MAIFETVQSGRSSWFLSGGSASSGAALKIRHMASADNENFLLSSILTDLSPIFRKAIISTHVS